MGDLLLIPRSRYIKAKPKAKRIDTVKDAMERIAKSKKNRELLHRAHMTWWSMDGFRKTRLRNLRYVYGDQWGDLVSDGKGGLITERQKLSRSMEGGVVLQNNHMFKVANTIEGVYLKSQTKPICFACQEGADAKSEMMTNALQTNYDNNMMPVLMQDSMRETINGGMPVVRVEWDVHNGVYDSYVYNVDPGHFFFESKGQDPRLWDATMVGEFRDFSNAIDLYGELKRKGSKFTLEEIESIYTEKRDDFSNWEEQFAQNDDLDFLYTSNPKMCRAYYIWTFESKTRYRIYDPMDFDNPVSRIEVEDLENVKATNEQRKQMFIANGITDENDMSLINYGQIMDENGEPYPNIGPIVDQYWYFQILACDGTVLVGYETPYKHGSHPYVWMCHHFVNGKVFPFISVIIDQQRYINRLISLHDLAISSSIKGLKMVPKNVLGGLTPRQFARRAVDFGGWIFYDPDPRFPNAMPQVIQQNSHDVATADLLKIEIDSINEISSVSGALQGKTPASGTAASRYAMEMENSTTSISSLFMRFTTYENEIATKCMNVIHQYYTEPHNISLKHSNGYASYGMYEPKEVEDIRFTVQIKESAATPVSRMQVNDLLQQMMMQGIISPIQMLRHGYFEGMEGILQELESAQEQGQGAPGDGIQLSQQAQQQLESAANPETVNAVRQALASA